jgi:hypothetical protein
VVEMCERGKREIRTGGVLDKSFKINWVDYRNSILLSRSGVFTKLNTRVYDIVTF